MERNDIAFVDALSDAELATLNELLDWNCFVSDARGRRFGNAAWEGKRCEPQSIPDARIRLLHERFSLSDKHVLEVGCFEGVHTVGLSMFAKKVTAIDARIENVVKTIVRCGLFGHHPTVFRCNVEERPLPVDLLRADIVCHIGVLYHLTDPVQHLRELGALGGLGILLDTHYANQDEATSHYEVGGRAYRYRRRSENTASVFSGTSDHAKWLTLTDIVSVLGESGFDHVDVVETRRERNGPRALLVGARG